MTGPSGGQKPKLPLLGVLLLDCLFLGLLPKFLLPDSSSLPSAWHKALFWFRAHTAATPTSLFPLPSLSGSAERRAISALY